MRVAKTTMEQIFAHADAEAPRECCGLLITAGKKQVYIPCKNEAVGSENFQLSAADFAAAEDQGKVLAVVHSHPNAAPTPSMADRVSCEATGLPWLIVGGERSKFWLEPKGYKAPLLGRPFVHGVLDCYSLVRDWYDQERGQFLADIERRDMWWDGGQNLYIDHFAEWGFVELSEREEMHPGDIFLMQIRASVPNHAAIYLGDGVILHHLYDRLSARTVYGGYWQTVTTHRLRYNQCVK